MPTCTYGCLDPQGHEAVLHVSSPTERAGSSSPSASLARRAQPYVLDNVPKETEQQQQQQGNEHYAAACLQGPEAPNVPEGATSTQAGPAPVSAASAAGLASQLTRTKEEHASMPISAVQAQALDPEAARLHRLLVPKLELLRLQSEGTEPELLRQSEGTEPESTGPEGMGPEGTGPDGQDDEPAANQQPQPCAAVASCSASNTEDVQQSMQSIKPVNRCVLSWARLWINVGSLCHALYRMFLVHLRV